jgi:hypothetical protein
MGKSPNVNQLEKNCKKPTPCNSYMTKGVKNI